MGTPKTVEIQMESVGGQKNLQKSLGKEAMPEIILQWIIYLTEMKC